MAIQNRRGVYSDFTPTKMVPGELAVVQSGDPNNTSGKAVYAAFGASGDVKRLATEDDLGSIDTELSNKVDKVSGKGLSTNDYTNTEKTKLAGIASGAEVNVQSDWNQSNTSADDFIKNKPTKTSDFTNDGDGTSNFATESYVQLNGGKIDTISVNGTQQTITNKNVDIPVPVIDSTLTQTGKAADAKLVGDELADVKNDLETKASVITNTASGSIARFEDGSDANAKSVIAYIEPVQEGNGDPSPDNIRPISGFTGMNVVRTGKNLSSVNQIYTTPSAIWERDVASMKDVINSLPIGTYTISVTSEVITLPDGGKVNHGRPYITAMVNGTQVVILGYSVTIDTSPTVGKKYIDTGTFSITESNKGKINHFYMYCDSDVHTGTGRGTYIIKNAQIELASTPSSYEEYQGQTIPITFPSEAGTVYGGYVDVTNGKLVVDRASVEYDGSSDEQWGEYGVGSANYCCVSYPSNKVIGYQKSICNEFKNQNNAFGSSDFGKYSDHPSLPNTYFRMPNSEVNTKSEFLAWIAQNPIQLCYELDTPITYDITPQQIELLTGVNNVWNDCNGDTDVEYNADTKLYIEQLTKPTEDDMTANGNIANATFFMIGNRLFLSTTSIAVGETIIPGTNCTELSLAEALNNLNA